MFFNTKAAASLPPGWVRLPLFIPVFRCKGTGWPWWGSVGIQCRLWRLEKHWYRSDGQTEPGTDSGGWWARAGRAGPCWQGPGGRCWRGRWCAAPRAGRSLARPPGARRCPWSPGRRGRCMCTGGAGWAGEQLQPRPGGDEPYHGWGCCAGRSMGPELSLEWCRLAVSGDSLCGQSRCAAGPG